MGPAEIQKLRTIIAQAENREFELDDELDRLQSRIDDLEDQLAGARKDQKILEKDMRAVKAASVAARRKMPIADRQLGIMDFIGEPRRGTRTRRRK